MRWGAGGTRKATRSTLLSVVNLSNHFPCLRSPDKGVTSVHRDHYIFNRSIERETKLKLTFFSRKHRRQVVSLCAPLHFSKSPTGHDEQDCYYLWDFGAKKGSNFLALSSSELVSMELTDEAFHTQEFHALSKPAKKPR